jgi:hypothetical protein
MVQHMENGTLAAREGSTPPTRIHYHVRLKAMMPTVTGYYLQRPSVPATASAREGGSGPHCGATLARGLCQRHIKGRAQ